MIFNVLFRLSLVSLIFFFTVSGCASSQQHGVNSLSQEKLQTWLVVLSVSGGFAGWARNISVDSAGFVIINDLKMNKSSRNKINNKELEYLSELVHQQKSVQSEAGGRGLTKNCADCFEYKLSIRWQNGQQLAVLNDINLAKSPYKDIVRFLRKMMSK